MVSTIIFAIITISLIAGAFHGLFSLMHTMDTMSMAKKNNVRMEAVADLLKNASIPSEDGSTYYAPMGSPGAVYTLVPRWVTMDTATPWGVAYAYCPFAPATPTGASGTTKAVAQADGTTYPVEVSTRPAGTSSATAEFVVAGTPAPDDQILGFLVSATVRRDHVPSCSQITFDPDTGAFLVPNGTVVPIKNPAVAYASIGYQTVSALCAPGSTSCAARCEAGKKVLTGACPQVTSASGTDLLSIVSFGPRQVEEGGQVYNEYACTWAAPLPSSGATMEATCANIR